MKKIILALLVAFQAVTFAGDAKAFVEKQDAQMQKLLAAKQKSPTKANRVAIKNFLGKFFDFEVMSKNTLGDKWDAITPEQQKRFAKAFQDMIENRAINKLKPYDEGAASFNDPETDDESGYIKVSTLIMINAEESEIAYVLKPAGASFKAVDLVQDDLSNVENYEEVFSDYFAKGKTIEDLIKWVEKKAAELAKK